jgi:hypothetical protein
VSTCLGPTVAIATCLAGSVQSSKRRVAIVIAVCFTAAGCATSTPALPSSDTPAAVHGFVTGENGRADLEKVSSYAWDDHGSAAAAYFSWIPRDSNAPDVPTATIAGESAHAVAAFLADEQDQLASIGHGFPHLRHSSVGALNPSQVAAYAAALVPFQGAMVGSDVGVRGFAPVKGVDVDDYSGVIGIFAAIASDPASGEKFNKSGYDQTWTIVSRAAATGCQNAASARSSTPVLNRAGALAGSMAVAVQRPGAAKLSVVSLGEADNEATLTVARECLAGDPNPPASVKRFMDGSALFTPEQLSQRLGEASMTEYYNSLESYVGQRGFDLRAFYDGFQKAAGLG